MADPRWDWAIRVPATSANLGPGFDVLGLALARFLVVGSRVRQDDEPRVVTHGEGFDEVVDGDENLLWQSFVRGCDAWQVDIPDLALTVHNDIPLERGLGSSSAAIIAGLSLARQLSEAAVGDLDVVQLADEIEGHPDNVAPAVLGGVVAAARRDDGTLAVRRAQPPPGARVLVHVPNGRQRTNAARRALPDSLSRADVATQIGRTAFVTGGMVGAWPLDAGVVGDRLHEPARRRGLPVSDRIIDDLRALGLASWLSGSGPTVAALVGPNFTLASLGEAERDDVSVMVLDIDLGGVIVCPAGGCAWANAGACGSCPHGRL